MKSFRKLALLVALVATFALPACSKGSDSKKEAKDAKPFTEQAKEAIQDYGKKPIDRARAAQGLGVERTENIDRAVEGQGQ